MKARSVFLPLATLSLLAGVISPAHAVKPSAGCPTSFEGPLTFRELIKRWPPPPDLEDPEVALAGYDVNGDKLLCVMEAPTQGKTPAPINVIDNVAKK